LKSLEELKAIREQMKKQMDVRDNSDDNIRVLVGMATCGIAAGAKPVLSAFLEEIHKRNLQGVSVTQTGCIGVCRLEPIVEVLVPGHEKVTYVKMKPDMVPQIVNDHLVNGQVVTKYTIGAAEAGGEEK
jgi:NADP-reducing hydrogenase subunit HndB